jgi:hypothetical protein
MRGRLHAVDIDVPDLVKIYQHLLELLGIGGFFLIAEVYARKLGHILDVNLRCIV